MLSTNGDELTLTPPDLLKFTLKAKRKAPTSKLVLKLAWKDEPKAAIRSDDSMDIRS